MEEQTTNDVEQVEATAEQAEPANDEQITEDTFAREYVEELRQENAMYRTRAKEVDALKAQLFDARVKLDGRLQDATDLPFDESLLDAGLEDAITNLIASKPHLAKRKPQGDIGAGKRGAANDETDLLAFIRSLT